MIRCSQMMLANTFLKLNMGMNDIINLFLDMPDKPFSIHGLTEEGKLLMSKQPGDWYGVNSIA